MLEILSHQDVTILGYYQSLLQAEGIVCFIRNENGQTLGGGFAGMFQRQGFLEPVLCIVADEELDRALEILRPHHQPPETTQPDWPCPKCKEIVPGSFEVCWSCEAPKPDPSSTA
jgi:hypothetical protein